MATSILVHRSDADVLDSSLELDERVGAVVVVARQSLARRAEVRVVAHSALVADACDVGLIDLVPAEGAIAVDACVASEHWLRLRDGVVDGREAVTSMLERSLGNARAAVVEVWAVQALVTDAEDCLVAAIADGVVANVATRGKGSLGGHAEDSTLGGGLETVRGMVAVFVGGVARDAQVEVIASRASDKLVLWQHVHAVVASASGHARFLGQSLGLLLKGTRNLGLDVPLDRGAHASAVGHLTGDFVLDVLSLASDTLGCAGDDLAVLDRALDQPVTFARAQLTAGDAGLTEIVVATVTDAAVVVRIVHGVVAVVAVDGPLSLSGDCGSGSRLTAAECEFTRGGVTTSTSELAEELRTIRAERTWRRGFRFYEGLLGSTCLAELEDATADGTAIEGHRVARRGLVVW